MVIHSVFPGSFTLTWSALSVRSRVRAPTLHLVSQRALGIVLFEAGSGGPGIAKDAVEVRAVDHAAGDLEHQLVVVDAVDLRRGVFAEQVLGLGVRGRRREERGEDRAIERWRMGDLMACVRTTDPGGVPW